MGLITKLKYFRLTRKFHDYRPQPVTPERIAGWIRQFNHEDLKAAHTLLKSIIYLSEQTVEKILVDQNQALVARLKRAGITPEKTIYMSVHDAGSSSPVMLNLLRDAARLERTKCYFIDGNNGLLLNKISNQLGEGAIVYVDDFAGTGQQFCKARNFISQSIIGNFSEFLLTPCLCEEAIYKLGQEGVDFYTGRVHYRAERPLHENSSILSQDVKERLRERCLHIHHRMGLGFEGLATMVILYRNAPNTVPLILRGSLDQALFRGIFPRTTDLPLPENP